MAQLDFINGTRAIITRTQSGKSTSNVVKKNGVDLYFFEYTIDTTEGNGNPTHTPTQRGNNGAYVSWGDGTISQVNSNEWFEQHTYSSAGTYLIRFTGQWSQNNANYSSDNQEKIVNISRWDLFYQTGGQNAFTSAPLGVLSALRGNLFSSPTVLTNAFNGSTIQSGFGVISFDGVTPTALNSCFRDATQYNEDLVGMNIVPSTMDSIFRGATSFNGDVSDWDTSSATSLNLAFNGASSFNQDLGNWDVSSVTSMEQALAYSGFNNGGVSGVGLGIDQWDVSNVTTMRRMFKNSTAFNAYIGSWSPSSCTDFYELLSNANSFNQDLSNWNFDNKKASGANTSVAANKLVDSGANFVAAGIQFADFVRNVTDNTLAQVASVSATELTLDSDIFTGTSKRYLIYRKRRNFSFSFSSNSFNSGLAAGVSGTRLSGWDTLGVTSLAGTFRGDGFNQDISTWQVGECTSLQGCFQGNANFNQDLSGWERTTAGDESTVANVTRLDNAFRQTSFNAGLAVGVTGTRIGNWDTSGATTTRECFMQNGAFNQNIGSWDTSSVTNMASMFYGSSRFNCGEAQGVSHSNMSGWNTSGVTSFERTFYLTPWFNGDIDAWDVSAATHTSGVVWGATLWDHSLASWVFQSGCNASQMCMSTSISDANVSATLIGWDNPSQGTGVNAARWCAINSSTPKTMSIGSYPAAKTAYDNLIASVGSGGKGWDMTGAISWVP